MSKLAVVTGASKGIGAETVKTFASEGYDVIINYHSDDSAAEELKAFVSSLGRKADLVKSDIFTEDGVNELFDVVGDRRIDVMVCNAGRPTEKPFGGWTAEDINNSLNANFTSAALCAQAAAVRMDAGGCILFTSSIYGINFGGSPSLTLYSAGKAAMLNFTQALAEILAPRGIRCNAVAPGTTLTPGWDGANPDYVKTSLGMTLQNEWVKPEEIAKTFLYLAQTPHITAQTIVVDAGWQKKIRK